MGFNFPASPAVGAIYQPGTGISYEWDGVGWRSLVQTPSQNVLFLPELAAAPSTPADTGALYSKDVAGRTELFYRREAAGTEIQFTKQGLIRGARYGVEFNFSGAASPWAFRGFPPGVTGFDIGVTNFIQTAGGQQMYLQLANSAGTVVNSGYRGALISASGTATQAVLSNTTYAALSSAFAANCGYGGVVQFRRGSAATGYWSYSAMGYQLGAAAHMWDAAGDLTAIVNDPQGFNFGGTGNAAIAGGNIRLEYWVD